MNENTIVAFAIGTGKEGLYRFDKINNKLSSSLDLVTIDVANGHSIYTKNMISHIKTINPNIKIIAGNVATGEGYHFLSENGADAVRVGIGGGSICKTRIMTGFGVPTLSSVIDCYKVKKSSSLCKDVSIIADGGIRYPSDLVKSIVVGADAIIAGNIFAATEAACGEVAYKDGRPFRVYRGMASKQAQDSFRGGLKAGTCEEGVQTLLPIDKKLSEVFSDYSGGLKSAMTYADSKNLKELRAKTSFVRITNSGLLESHAYGTRRK